MSKARALRRIWFICIWVSVAVWAVAAARDWVESVVFISHVSMFAIVLQFVMMYLEARVEVKQERGSDGR